MCFDWRILSDTFKVSPGRRVLTTFWFVFRLLSSLTVSPGGSMTFCSVVCIVLPPCVLCRYFPLWLPCGSHVTTYSGLFAGDNFSLNTF